MSDLLSAQNLGLVRGDRLLFRGIGFALNPGDLLHIEGPNGSGKTSLLRLVAGLTEPASGAISWRGRDIHRHAQAYRNELAWVGHKPGFKHDLTLVDNLRCERALRRPSTRHVAQVFDRLALSSLTDLPMRALSAGQQRRVALARLLLTAAPLWFVDEPLTNLDRDGQALACELIAEHLAAGGICVAASHQSLAIDAPLKRLALS